MSRLVCACGTPIPTARAGSEHCSTECDQAEVERQRDTEWHGLMDGQPRACPAGFATR